MGLDDDDGALAGWHRDPSGRHELRFWSGDAWTEHIIDEGIPGLDFPTRSGRAPGETVSPVPPPPPFEEVVASELTPEVLVEPMGTAEVVEPIEVGVEVGAEVDVNVAVELETPELETPELETPELETPEVDLVAESAADRAAAVEVAEVAADEHLEGIDAIDVAIAAAVADVARPTRPGGRSLRTRRRAATPAPPTPPPSEPEIAAPVAELRQGPVPESTSAPDREPERAPEPVPAAEQEQKTVRGPEPKRTPEPVHATLDAPIVGRPTVASPAGNSAGSNTSAIADPHRAHRSPNGGEPADAPRVAGVAPVPVKRYRPGSPPPSPFARPQALPVGATNPVGTIIVPWYQRPAGWISIVALIVVAALAVAAILSATGDDANPGLTGRPPAAAPQGSKIIDGDGFGIAAPAAWIVATDTGNAFPQLRHDDWGTQLAATDTANGEALIVVPLVHLRHNPQVDPELFWSDQVRAAGSTRTITPGPPFGVHGFRANRVTVTDPSGKALVAASIDTGDRTYLVAFTAKSETAATTGFERLIQTFDAR